MNKTAIKSRLEEAAKRGFKSGEYFISASGTTDCLVSGTLLVKYTSDKTDENYPFNGDVVSTGGYGVIYNAESDTWGILLEEELVGSGITGINARKISSKDRVRLHRKEKK